MPPPNPLLLIQNLTPLPPLRPHLDFCTLQNSPLDIPPPNIRPHERSMRARELKRPDRPPDLHDLVRRQGDKVRDRPHECIRRRARQAIDMIVRRLRLPKSVDSQPCVAKSPGR